MLNLNKKMVVGVSVTPEVGLEVAVVDFTTKTIMKYACKPLAYDYNRRVVADLDLFKDTLEELLFELQIPKGSDIVLNVPTVYFNVLDYPATLEKEQVESMIEEDLLANPIFEETEPALAISKSPLSTLQSTKYACMAAHKISLIEMIMQIQELGYNLIGIDTSVNSTLNSMIYNDSLNGISPETSWVLLLVENSCCRAIMMQGTCYVESYEEKISIGEVLGDEENYSTVISALNPILKNIPSKFLYVMSKTNIISAKILANKLTYSSQIIHQDANIFAEAPLLEAQDGVNEQFAKFISPEVIGAAIKRKFDVLASADLDLYNKSLGDIFTMYQPPEIKLGNKSILLNEENMIKASLAYVLVVALIFVLVFVPILTITKNKQTELEEVNNKISTINTFLKNNESISSSLFDEGDEIRIGLVNNKKIYSYYTIVGTEIPQKLWLTGLRLGENIVIEGQADNLESVYGFFRNIKDYNVKSGLKLQKLGLATKNTISKMNSDSEFDTDSILSSMNADFYEFKISDEEEAKNNTQKDDKDTKEGNKSKIRSGSKSKTASNPPKTLPNN